MYIKQEPIDLDVESAPSIPILMPRSIPLNICNVSYDSIYDDPDFWVGGW